MVKDLLRKQKLQFKVPSLFLPSCPAKLSLAVRHFPRPRSPWETALSKGSHPGEQNSFSSFCILEENRKKPKGPKPKSQKKNPQNNSVMSSILSIPPPPLPLSFPFIRPVRWLIHTTPLLLLSQHPFTLHLDRLPRFRFYCLSVRLCCSSNTSRRTDRMNQACDTIRLFPATLFTQLVPFAPWTPPRVCLTYSVCWPLGMDWVSHVHIAK